MTEILLGQIVITFRMREDEPAGLIGITLPDLDDVPLVTQLGMLELARDLILHPPSD